MSETYSGPASVVQNQVKLANEYADEAFDTTISFLDQLAAFTASVNPISEAAYFENVTTPNPDFVVPSAPVAPNINPVSVTIPTFSEYTIDADFGDLPVAPEFTADDPTLNLPNTPDALNIDAPDQAPIIETDFDYPDAPTYTLPDVPTLEELNLPTAPTVEIPQFLEDLPDVTKIGNPPANNFTWNEVPYTDALLELTQSDLINRITNGGTGLNPVVEQALWDRARNREDKNALRSKQELIKGQASRGFSKPTGSLQAGLDFLAQETQNKNADLSREIAIKQAELEQSNLRFAIENALSLETQLLSYNNSVQQRAFEAEKVTLDFAIQIYQAQVQQFSIELEAYKTAADIFETEIRAELAKIEIYKQQLEAQGLVNDINDSRVRLYIARLDGVKTAVDVYKSEIEAVDSRVRAEGLKLENYKTSIDAYSSQVAAKRDEYAIYSEQVRAELAKVDVFEAQARAFAARIQSYASQADVEAKKVDAQIQAADAHTKAYIAKIDGLIKQAQANQLQVTSAIDIYRGEAALFGAQIDAESARVDAESKVYDIAVREATANAEIAIKNAEIALANADNIAKLQLEAIKSGATVAAQLAASSLSALNIGASISGSAMDYHYYEEK